MGPRQGLPVSPHTLHQSLPVYSSSLETHITTCEGSQKGRVPRLPWASKNSRSESESLIAMLSRAHSGLAEYMLSPSESPSTLEWLRDMGNRVSAFFPCKGPDLSLHVSLFLCRLPLRVMGCRVLRGGSWPCGALCISLADLLKGRGGGEE